MPWRIKNLKKWNDRTFWPIAIGPALYGQDNHTCLLICMSYQERVNLFGVLVNKKYDNSSRNVILSGFEQAFIYIYRCKWISNGSSNHSGWPSYCILEQVTHQLATQLQYNRKELLAIVMCMKEYYNIF